MKKLIAKLKINPLTLTAIMGILFFFGNSFQPTVAQVAAGGKFPYPFQNATVETNNLCEPEMRLFAKNEMDDFNEFLDKNFQNKSSTSSLLSLAIGKYREMKTELNTGYNKYYPKFGSLQLTTGIQPDGCKKIIDETLADARIALKRHAVRTSGVKKSTALLQKYKQINGELANLYQRFVFMKSYLSTFSTKLPCYPKTGCLKG